MEEKEYFITGQAQGYAHTKIWGTFTGPVTVEDIKNKFYHDFFGGRDARVDPVNKTFFAIRHND